MDPDRDQLLSELFDADLPDRTHIGLNLISEKIIGGAFKVGNSLGCGFLEKVYENALAYELIKMGLAVSQQQNIVVTYEGIEVGKYEADLVVEGQVLVELKAVRDMNDIHKAQCINYLRATGLKLCLLINFGNPRVEIKRIVL